MPGREKRDHLLSSMIVRDDPDVQRRGPGASEAWDVVRREIAAHDGDALVSHEFFCAASAEQAERMVADLAPAEVHVVVTAREPLGLFTSSWQESLKNLGTTPLEDYGRTVSEDPRDVWDWRSLDLGLVLDRWSPAVPGRAAAPGGGARVPGCPARSCGGGSPGCSGSTPTWCRTRRRSPTRPWAWSRPRRCAG